MRIYGSSGGGRLQVHALDALVDPPVHVLVAQHVIAPAGARSSDTEAGSDRCDRDPGINPPWHSEVSSEPQRELTPTAGMSIDEGLEHGGDLDLLQVAAALQLVRDVL